MQHVHVFDYTGSGAVTVVAARGCDVYTWLDVTFTTTPTQTRAASEPIAYLAAYPLSGVDRPGYVALVSSRNGDMAVMLGGQGRVSARQVEDAAFAPARRGYMHALGTVVNRHDGPAWIAKMARGSAGYSWLESTVSRLTALAPRRAAPRASLIDAQLVQTGPAAWRAVTLTADTISCWHIDATAASSISCQCTWSLDIAPALTRFSNSRETIGVRLAVQGSALCLLCARKLTEGGRRLALAFFQLPRALGGEVPEPHFYVELPHDYPEGTFAQPWQLAMRPDIEQIVASGGKSYTILIAAPSGSGGTQNIAWQHSRGTAEVLPEVRDTRAVLWSSTYESWQLLSAVFGVLLVRESDASQHALPVAPLLEAAIARQLDGEGMPGLAAALQHTHGLSSAADGSNPIERFSYSLINTLAKEYAAERARTHVSRALQLKQQRHSALLDSLFAAGALSNGQGKEGLLPHGAAFRIVEHAEHIASMIAVHTHLSAALAEAQSTSQAALNAALKGIEVPSELPVSAEEWLFSCPTEHCSALSSGIAEAATQPELPIAQLEALAGMLHALHQGAHACRATLAKQHRVGFLATQRCAYMGWLAQRDCRDSLRVVVATCLTRLGMLSGKWTLVLIELMQFLLASHKQAVTSLGYGAADAQSTADIVMHAQTACSRFLETACSSTSYASGLEPAVMRQLQDLASTPLEESFMVNGEERIASAEHLLKLCDADLQEQHIRTCDANSMPLTDASRVTLASRLAAEVIPGKMAYKGLLVQPAGPALSAAETSAHERFHTYLANSAAFRHHVFASFCTQRRIIELLALPPGLQPLLSEFLSKDASLLGVQWLQHACCGEQQAVTDMLQRFCREPNIASGSVLTAHAPADHSASAQIAAVRGRAAYLCKMTALLDKKVAVAAAAWDSEATETELRACGAFAAASNLMQLLAAQGCETASASDVPSMDDLLAKAATSLDGSTETLLAALTLACKLALCNPRYLQQAGGTEWSALWQRVVQADKSVLHELRTTAQDSGSLADSNQLLEDSTLYRAVATCVLQLRMEQSVLQECRLAAVRVMQEHHEVSQPADSVLTGVFDALFDRAQAAVRSSRMQPVGTVDAAA